MDSPPSLFPRQRRDSPLFHEAAGHDVSRSHGGAAGAASHEAAAERVFSPAHRPGSPTAAQSDHPPISGLGAHTCSHDVLLDAWRMLFYVCYVMHLGSTPHLNISADFNPSTHSFSSFQLPDISEITELIRKSKPSTCQLDPLPTHLVKASLPSLIPLICAIIHSSLTTGTIPTSFKTAAITPILKKPGADPSNFNNFRPISNLPFISKILEKTVASQLHFHYLTITFTNSSSPDSAHSIALKQHSSKSPTTSLWELILDY